MTAVEVAAIGANQPPFESAPRTRVYWAGLCAVVVASLAVRVFFWTWTAWTIEDAMIIGRIARNLVEHGQLSYNLTQRVSTATSPLFAVLVAAVAWLGPAPIVAAKVLGVIASAATCALVYDLLCDVAEPMIAAAASSFYVLLPPVVAYSVGGMETPVYTLAVFAALERFVRHRKSQAAAWAAFAFLLRPDGAVVLAVVSGAAVGAREGSVRNRLTPLWPVAVLVPLGIFLHWAYYGALFPQTVLAKAAAYRIQPLWNTWRYLDRMLLSQPSGLPIYGFAAAGVVWSAKRAPRLLLILAWYLIYHLFFMLRAPLFDWYLQPPLVALSFFAALGFLAAISWAANALGVANRTSGMQLACCLIFAVGLLMALIPYGRGKTEMQRYEESVRAALGKWLNDHTDPKSLVFTESLGYIGYNASNPFVDWPGLTARAVPGLLASETGKLSRQAGYDVIVQTYQPEYLAIRNLEWSSLALDLKAHYQVCATFPSPSANQGQGYVVAGRDCEGRTTAPRPESQIPHE